jgi:type II secretory pathway component PulF
MEGLARAGRYAWYWGPILPALLAVLAVRYWLVGSRAATCGNRGAHWLIGWMPWMGQMLRYSRAATFLDVLALLVENQTPLPEGLVLAAEASGDPDTLRSARLLATALENGQTQPAHGELAFPPLVNWLLLAAGRDDALLPALQHAAATCRRRARHKSDLLRVFTPVLFTLVIGGGTVALYALMLFLPYVSLLYAMGK